MSLNRWNARRDETEPDIVTALRRAGAEVIRLDVFDLLVLYRGQLFMIDAKRAKGRRTEVQAGLVRAGWPLLFIETPIDALRAIGAFPQSKGV